MEKLYARRDGSIIVCDEEFELVDVRGMAMEYLRRLARCVEPNVVNYIDIASSDRSPESLRMSFTKISKEQEIDIRTFTKDGLFAFMIVKPESVFI